jgi:RNA polymerase sigma factor (sigma-70 family)
MSTGDPLAERDEFESSVSKESHTKALADLYREHQESLLRILSARTGSRDVAKEILQEALAKMLELDRRPKAASFLASYLWKIAHNLVVDRQRREATRTRLDPVWSRGREEFAASPEEVLHEQQCLTLMEQAIDKLPSEVGTKCFEAFVLRVQHGLTFKEVGKRMDIGERMAQLYVARALEYCQNYLDAAPATRRMPK